MATDIQGLANAVSLANAAYDAAYQAVVQSGQEEVRQIVSAKQLEVQAAAEAAGLDARDAYFAASAALLQAADAFNAT
jgi:hypothetical protein